MEASRGILILYLELLVTYIRVMIMFTSIEERKAIAAMYTASYYAAKETNEPNLGEYVNFIYLYSSLLSYLCHYFLQLLIF